MNRKLSDIDYNFTYRSNRNDIVSDFFIPSLMNSKLYYRGVGYFSAKSLSEMFNGLEVFIDNGGMLKLITSPILSKNEVDSIIKGYREREYNQDNINKIISNSLIKEIKVMSQENKNELEVLSWLIAEGKLDIRLAIRDEGIYHEKFGIFFEENDENSYRVAFIGSSNETKGGLTNNFERISVFQDKFSREKLRINEFVDDFISLWENRTNGVDIMDFSYIVSLPEDVKNTIIKYRPKSKPTLNNRVKHRLENKIARGYQNEAVREWIRNGRKGILSMATASGKTFTSIIAVRDLVMEGKLLIIIVPANLLKQWEEDIKDNFENPLILTCGGGNANWKKEIVRYTRLAKLNINKKGKIETPIIILSSIETARSDIFRSNIESCGIEPKNIVLLIDEVHRIGSSENSNILNINADAGRLGLSATPIRRGDEEGTEKIINYFDKVVFDFSIRDAINHNPPVLCKYDYHIHFTYLEPHELEEYRKISKKIAKNSIILKNNSDMYNNYKDSLNHLLILRKKIIKHASNKLNRVKHIINEYNPEKCIIYCDDIKQVDLVFNLVTKCGKKALKYTGEHLKGIDRKKIIDLFESDQCDYLISIKCLDEGININRCESEIVLSSSTNDREFIQRRGRVLRLHPKKSKAVIHDIVVLPCNPINNEEELSEVEYKLLKYELDRSKAFAMDADNVDQCVKKIIEINRAILKITKFN